MLVRSLFSFARVFAGVTAACGCLLGSSADAQSPRVYREQIDAHWFENGDGFWYRNDNPGDTREFILVDAESGERSPAFDHESVARTIGGDVTAATLPIDEIEFSEDRTSVTLIGADGTWKVNRSTGEVSVSDRGASGASGIEAAAFIRPSRSGGAETSIVLENRLDREVSVVWVNTEGDRVVYGVLQPGGRRDQHTYANHVWLLAETGDDGDALGVFVATDRPSVAILDENTRRPRERRRGGRGRGPDAATVVAPDGRREAFVREHQLWLRNVESGEEKQLSSDGSSEWSYHRDAIRTRAMGMNYERPDYPDTLPEVHWSPDSKRLIAIRTKVVPEPRVYLIESAPSDQLQPKLDSYPYIKPGGEIPLQEVHLFDADSGREVTLDQSLWENAWGLGRFDWNEDSSRFTFLYNRRGHQLMRFIAIDGVKGEATILIEEKNDTFIDYSQKNYLNRIEGTDHLVWMSERDGWNHLYLFDAKKGGAVRQLTKGEWVVRRVERLDEDTGELWFWAGGVYPDQDPYYLHLGCVDLKSDGAEVRFVTDGDGTHSVEWSPDNRFLIDTWSRVDQPPVHELRRASDGELLCRLDEADAGELLAEGRRFPERFVAKGRDGETDIYGIIHYPEDFDPNATYPVIESIYAGPHGAFVPKAFRGRGGAPGGYDEHGYVVVRIDGMGTNWRSKAFHDVAWKNIKDAGYPDRILWMKAAAATRPWMDISRVGVFGGSAGGQNAMRAVLDHSDFYDAAAADCGCHDNRMDKIWWNEAWMGWPVDESYAKSSNVVDAHKLGGALLLTVGELDKNVDPASTYQVVDALKKADKDFEFMLMTGGGHGSGNSPYGRRIRLDFFNRHLKGE